MNKSLFYCCNNNRKCINNNYNQCENKDYCDTCSCLHHPIICPDIPCPCVTGATGPTGPQGPIGPQGPAGIPAATGATGTDVSFPQDGPNSGSGIVRTSASSFNLADIGSYQILFQVSTDEAGQLVLTLNGSPLDYTVVGRATGTSQIIGMAIVTTTSVNSILTVRNPADNTTALTITASAGGTEPVSAHLVITQLQ